MTRTARQKHMNIRMMEYNSPADRTRLALNTDASSQRTRMRWTSDHV